MFDLDIPGFKPLQLENIVLDFNGTIAFDGKLLPGVAERLTKLCNQFSIYVITADTFGTVQEQMAGLARVKVLESGNHRDEKYDFVFQLGSDSVIAFGNGRNDVMLLKAASVGIAVCQQEGAAAEALLSADAVVHDILDGLDLLLYPKRLLATLRA